LHPFAVTVPKRDLRKLTSMADADDPQTALSNLLHRHCVNIQATERLPNGASSAGKSTIFIVISAFVMDVDSRWFLVTAGHCLKEIETAEQQGCTFENWALDDAIHPGAKHQTRIPLDYRNTVKFPYYEPGGADYALFYRKRKIATTLSLPSTSVWIMVGSWRLLLCSRHSNSVW
jgi:hypothetical protein